MLGTTVGLVALVSVAMSLATSSDMSLFQSGYDHDMLI